MEKWAQQEKRYFESFSARKIREYEKDYFWYYANVWFLLFRIKDWIRRHPNQRVRVLDVGCGPAVSPRRYFQKQKFNPFYLGLDLSFPLLACAKKSFPGAVFIQSDLNYLPLREQKFDFILSLGVMHHLQDIDGCLKNLSSLLAEGGELLIQEPNENAFLFWNGSSPKERAVPAEYLTEAGRRYGLRLLRIKTVNSLLIFRLRRGLKKLRLDLPKIKALWLVKTWLEGRWEPWGRFLPIFRGMNSFYIMGKRG